MGELFDQLRIDRFACLGESNGGMVTLAIAATMAQRVLGAVTINPTLPWFDPMARRLASCSTAWAYRIMTRFPGLVVRGMPRRAAKESRDRFTRKESSDRFDPKITMGPPPGTEADVGNVLWEALSHITKSALTNELAWTGRDWGFDLYAIPVPLDFFCGVQDVQAPFALFLAENNANGRFHYFRFGHHGYCHPDARRRIFDTVAQYFGSEQ